MFKRIWYWYWHTWPGQFETMTFALFVASFPFAAHATTQAHHPAWNPCLISYAVAGFFYFIRDARIQMLERPTKNS